ncbi:MAG: MCE family protein [Phascolarctobacterium sp.]|nr:MCE family protein [Phascolarctobacterium sp.]
MASSEVKVGAFTLGGAAILAGIITFMGAFTFGKEGYKLQIDYPQVSGLMPGHVVRYAGVQVGTVKDINVQASSVAVIAEIEDNIKIPQGALFTIGSDGILGEKFVNVVPPKSFDKGYINEGGTVKGVPGGSMEEFFSASGDAVQNIFGDKDTQLAMRETIKHMNEISQNMSVITKTMADVSSANQQNLDTMVKQMAEMTARMNGISYHMESLMAGVDNKGATGQNIASIVENMKDITDRFDNMVKVLETVASDPVTADALKGTIVNVKEASGRANKILGTVSDARLSADVSSTLKDSDWRSNFGVTLTPSKDSTLYLGGYDIGNSNKFDFIASKSKGNLGMSMGAMQGEFGVGLSYDFGKSFRIYSQLYDFDDSKVRLGGEVRVTDNLSLYGESMDLKGNKSDTYVGVRSYF